MSDYTLADRLRDRRAALRPFIDHDRGTWRAGVEFYRFGLWGGEHWCLTVHAGHRSLSWEGSRG